MTGQSGNQQLKHWVDEWAAILQPEDVAAAVRFLVELPQRASVPELVMTPSVDEFF